MVFPSKVRPVLDHCPLQQGLRLTVIKYNVEDYGVLDHCPLQQGLRPVN